jgi:hypothetical protein
MLELEQMNVPFVVVCGEKVPQSNVVYREAMGKWDAINFAAQSVPKEAEIIVLNDVDTTIHHIEYALHCLDSADIVYCRVNVTEGPQVKFYKILDPVRKNFHICASGELLLIKKPVFERTMPVPPCMAEDSYILFKALELGYRAHFCTATYVTTKRTTNSKAEETYKTRTTLGIYQALKYAKPSPLIRVFYSSLPLTSLLLSIAGDDGKAWAKGIQGAVKSNIKKTAETKF